MNEFDHVEGVNTADLYEDLYDVLIRLCFLEGHGMLMEEEETMLESMLDVVHTHNPSWMEVVLGEPDDGDNFMGDEWFSPEDDE